MLDLSVSFQIRRAGDLPWRPPRVLQVVRGSAFALRPGKPVESQWKADRAKARLPAR